MPDNNLDLLLVERGAITAPAGCGKTHLIARDLKRHEDSKPALVLTHTNAGVAALRKRLNSAGVPSARYRLSTIDGWAIRLIATFPARSGHDPDLLQLASPATDYPNIRAAAATLLRSEHIFDVIQSSYSRLIVDEYQDCSIRQHSLISWAAQALPTCVLGDPMQAIFGFGADPLASWEDDVTPYFPIVAELDTPWRWINAQSEPLGRWLLAIRAQLLEGEPVDLRQAPAGVDWVHLDGTEDHVRCLRAARVNPPNNLGSVLVLGESTSPQSQQRIASQTPGAVTVEAVDLKDLTNFARAFQPASEDALALLLNFAQRVLRGVRAAAIMQRISSLKNGRARNPPTDAETAILAFIEEPSFRTACNALEEIMRQTDVSTHRPAVLHAGIQSLKAATTGGITFHEAAVQIRERNRLIGRPIPRRAVGSTLLLKGLEAEVVVVLNASDLNARNLYVAMTRGSKRLTICSTTPILRPRL